MHDHAIVRSRISMYDHDLLLAVFVAFDMWEDDRTFRRFCHMLQFETVSEDQMSCSEVRTCQYLFSGFSRIASPGDFGISVQCNGAINKI